MCRAFQEKGKVASGCMFPDGSAVLHWNSAIFTTTVFSSMDDVKRIHGHNGGTRIEWVVDDDTVTIKVSEAEQRVREELAKGDPDHVCETCALVVLTAAIRPLSK